VASQGLIAATRWLGAGATLAAGGLLVFACRGSGAASRVGGQPHVAPQAAASAGASPATAPPEAPAIDRGMPEMAVVLDDPRLAHARDLESGGDEGAAAREVERAMPGAALGPSQTCAWTFVAGRLHLTAGEGTEAAAAFERVAAQRDDAGTPCLLAPYANLRQAQALLRAGQFEQAVVVAQGETSAGDDLPIHDERTLVLADALAGKGDRAAAVPLWRSLLVASPHGSRWVDLSVQLATALLDGADGPPAVRAQEALDRATRVFIEAPAAADRLGVADVRQRAAAAMKRRSPPALTAEEQVRQAEAWLDASQPKRARDAVEALPPFVPPASSEGDHHERQHHEATSCRAAIVRAQAAAHGKAELAADAWGTAITRCRHDDALVTALYYGAKASASARRNAEAVSRFERVEKLFPKHRLADDARLRAALVVQDEGDEARSLAMLASIPDAYPEGDMRGEALFRVALAKLEKRDFDGARAALDRLLALEPAPGPVASAGRGSAGRTEYFRARVAELSGDVDDAKRRYAAIVEGEPFDYYMLLAFARLRAQDEPLARSTLEQAAAREPAGPFLTHEHAEFASPVFERIVALLEVGEVDAARHEAVAGGVAADGADPEVLWALAWLYDRAGAADLGHAFARGRLVDYRSHWPSGRWRLAWEVAYPRAWSAFVTRECESSHLSPALAWAVMREESAFDPDARSPASAIGLMQLITPTARLVARDTPWPWDELSLHRPDVSIALGARLLASLRGSFPIHPALAIAAYNSGGGAVRRWLQARGTDAFDVFVERIPFDETRAYVKRVLASEAAYAYLYDPADLEELFAVPATASPPAPAEAVASP
jgi:soluble lytic murein transglycosylase